MASEYSLRAHAPERRRRRGGEEEKRQSILTTPSDPSLDPFVQTGEINLSDLMEMLQPMASSCKPFQHLGPTPTPSDAASHMASRSSSFSMDVDRYEHVDGCEHVHRREMSSSLMP